MDKTGPFRPQPAPRPPVAGEETVAVVTALLDRRAADAGPAALRRLVEAAADGAGRLVGRPVLAGGLSALGASLLNTGAAVALPDLATVNSGALTADRPSPGTLTLNQGTRHADATFRSFDIDAGETVTVRQPSAQSTLTARVAPGASPTTITGALNANGHVTIINGSGVIFSKGAKIDVGSIVATTATRAVVDPASGVMTFAGAEAGSAVVNKGDITVRDGGFAALVAPTVRNDGTIHARLGKVTLASAQSFTVDPYGDRLVSFEIGSTKTVGRVDQGGAIHADGGVVVLDAGGLDRMVDGVLNMDGMVRARSVGIENGEVVLGGAAVTVAGTVDVAGTGAGETGGRVTVTGGTASLADGAVIEASGTAGGGTVSFGGDDGTLARLDISDTATVRAAGTGRTAAGAAADGGSITARTTDSLAIAGELDVSGGGDGGSIVLQSGGEAVGSGGSSIFLGTARLDGDSGNGGTFALLGDAVRLDAGASVSATGGSGGGTVRIGGGYRGGEGVRTAKTTVVDENAAIDASATRAGDGGTIIVWSDDVTTVDGSLTARGAGAGGDGGLIETSGKRLLKMTKVRVDAGADDGAVGSWLLDPSLIRVRSGSGAAGLGDVSAAGNPNTDGPESIIDVALIDAATATVTLAATSGIVFETAVTMVNAGVGLTATVDNGYIQVDSGATITTNNGDVTFTANGGDITIGAAIDTNGGDLSLTATGAGSILQNANIETNNGIAALTAGGMITQAAGVALAVADGTVSMTAGGNITLSSVTSTRSFATVQDAIIIESTSGHIIDTDTDTDIKAGTNARARLTAQGNIGQASTTANLGIETEVGHLSLTGSGNMMVSNKGDLSLEVDQSGGYTDWVSVKATGGTTGNSITVAGAGIVTTGNTVRLEADDQINLNENIKLSASNPTKLEMRAGGDITQATNKIIEFNIGILDLKAGTGIVGAGGGGALQVKSMSALQLEALTNSGPMRIAAQGAGTMHVKTATIASGTGDLFLRQRGGGDISVTGAVRHDGTGTVELLADRTIDLAPNGLGGGGSIEAGGGNVSLKSDHDGDGTGAVLNSGGGTITMDGGRLTLAAADGIGTATAALTVALRDDIAIDATTVDGGISLSATGSAHQARIRTARVTGTTAADIAISHDGTLTVAGSVDNQSSGAVTISGDQAVTVGAAGAITSADGAVDITSAHGAITMADGARIDAGAGTIGVTAHGDVALASLTTTNTATASPVVAVTSHTGKIIDGGDTHRDIDAQGLVALTAATGIGDGDRLETSITSLTLDNSLSGAIDLESDTNLAFSAYQGGSGAVSIESTGGDLTLTTLWSHGTHRHNGLEAGGDVTLTTFAGMLDLLAASVVDGKFDLLGGMDIQVSGNIDMTGGTGKLTVSGGDAVRIDHATITTNGAVDLTGPTDVEITGGSSISADGAVTVTASNKIRIDGTAHGAEIDAGSGAITLDGDVILGQGTVDLATTAGAITVNGAIDGTTAGAEHLTLAAGGAIHIGGAIGATTKLGALTIKDAAGVDFTAAINAASITQDAGQAGATTAFNGAVVVDTGVDLTTAGAVAINTDITAATGDVTIKAGEAVSLSGISTVFTPVGSVDIQSTGSTITQAHGSSINAGSRGITLKADGDIDLGLLITTGTDPGAAVSVTSDAGAITMADGTRIDAGAATIDMTAAGDITLGLLTTTATGSAVTPAVAVTSTGGGIIDADTTGGADITATGGAVSLAAATGIGAGNPLEIDAATLTASNNNAGGATSGAIEIELAQSTIITGLDQQAAHDGIALTVAAGSGADIDIQGSGITAAGTGDVAIEAEGAIRVDAAITHAGSGDVVLGDTGGTDIRISAAVSTGGSVDIGRGATGTTTLTGLGAHTSLIDAGNKLVLHQNTVLAANSVKLDAGAGGMVFEGTVDGGQALAVEASGSGVIDFRQAVGGTTRLAGLAARAARIKASGGVIETDWAQTYAGDVLFTGAMSVASQHGPIMVGGTLDADRDVTIAAGAGAADVTITGDVGSGTAPTSLDITAATTTLGGSVTTTGLQRYSNAVALNGGRLQSTGGATLDFGGAVTLASAASTIDSNGGDITFAGTIDGGQDLTVDAGTGMVDFQGDIGGMTAVGSLDVTARNTNVRSVTTTGAQTYTGRLELFGSDLRTDGAAVTFNDTVLLTGAATIDTTGGGTTPTGGDIAFKGAGTSLSGRNYDLTLTAGSGGDVSIDNKVGPTASCMAGSCKQPLGALTVTAARDVTFGKAIAARQLAVTAHGKMTAQAITTDGNGGVGVDLTADSFDLQGAITTGNRHRTTGQSTSITATGSAGIHFGAAADITHTTGTAAITVTAANGDITMADGAAFDSKGGTITLDARNGDIALGRLITSHAGATAVTLTAVKGKITDAGDTGGADVSTGGGGLVVDTRDGVGTVANPIETEIASLDVDNVGNGGAASGDIAVSNAGHALTVGHLTQDAAHGAVALDTSTAHDIVVNTAITTDTGAITIDSGAAVHVTRAVQSSGGGAIAITGATTVDTHAGAAIGSSGTGAITLTAGGGDLTLGDSVTSGSGGITATATNDITIDGAISGHGAIAVTATNDIAVNAAVSGSSDITLDAGTDLTVNAGITSTSHTTTDTLTLKAGNALDINQDIRSHDATIKLTGPAALVFDADITATGAGNIEVNSAVTLDGASVVTSTSGDIDFADTIDGAQAFEIRSGSGTATVKGDVGGTTSLASLTTAGAVDFEGNDVTTSGAQRHLGRTSFAGGTVTSTGGALRFDATVTLGGATTTTLAAASGVTFGPGANITGTTAYAESLSVDGGTGAVSFGAAVGQPVPLAGLDARTSGTGTITLNDASVGTLDLSTQDGNIALQGAVAINGPGLSTIKSTGTGGISQSGAVSVGTGATYKLETNSGNIDITGTVDGPGSLVGDAGSGDITGGGIFGGTTKLDTVDLSGRIVTVDSVRTTGAQTYRVDPASGHLKVVGGAKFVGGPITVHGPTLVKANVLNLKPASDVNLHGGLITLSNPFDVIITNQDGKDVDVNIGGAGVGSALLPFGNLIIDGVNNINIAGSVYVDGTMQLSATLKPDSAINIAAPVTVNGDRATISSVTHLPEYNPDYTALLYAGAPGSGSPAGAVNVKTGASLTVRGNTLLAGKLDVNNVKLSGDAPNSGRTLTVGGVSGKVFGSIDGVGGRAAAQLATALPGADPAKLLINSCPVTTVCGLTPPTFTLRMPSMPVAINVDPPDLFNVMKYEELHFFDAEKKEELYASFSNTGNSELW